MSEYSNHTDNDLALLLQQGDMDAFNHIYNRYFDKIFDSAYKRLHNITLCEEIVQEVFTRLWERRASLEFTTGISNYLYTAVKYKVFDVYREQLVQGKFTAANNRTDYDNSTIEQIFLNDLKRHIEILVEELPDKCRSVYQLSRVEHKSNKEIAALLNISEKTVEGHLTKALSKLKLNLQTSDYLTVLIAILLDKNIK